MLCSWYSHEGCTNCCQVAFRPFRGTRWTLRPGPKSTLPPLAKNSLPKACQFRKVSRAFFVKLVSADPVFQLMSQFHSHLFKVSLSILEHSTETWRWNLKYDKCSGIQSFQGSPSWQQFPLHPSPRPMYSPVLRPRSLPLPEWRDKLWPCRVGWSWCPRLRSLTREKCHTIGIKPSWPAWP